MRKRFDDIFSALMLAAAVAMALEKLGRMQVLRVKIQEEEQLRMEEKQV